MSYNQVKGNEEINLGAEENLGQTRTQGSSSKMKVIVAVIVGACVIVAAAVVAVLLLTQGSDSSCTDDGYTEVRFDGDYLKVRKFTTISKFNTYPFVEAQEKCRKEKAELWEVRSVNEWNAVLTAGKNDQNWADTFWLNSRPKDICNRNCTRSDEDVQAGKGYPVVWDISQKYFGYSLVKKAAIEENQCLHVKLEDSKVWTYETCNNQHDALCVKRGCEDPNRK